MKPKRIKAEHGLRLGDGGKYERLYVLRQSDVRALAEQFIDDSEKLLRHKFEAASRAHALKTVTHCFKRAGITPGRARKGTK